MNKEIILGTILENDYYNSIAMYKLIKTNAIDLTKINNTKKQFIELFNHLLNRFDDHFPLLNSIKIFIFKKLLCLEETIKYLNCSNNIRDDNYIKYYENLINTIFSKNFLNSLELLQNNLFIKNLLKENNIDLSNVNLKNIINLMEKLVFCSDKLDAMYLFNDVSMKEKTINPNKTLNIKDLSIHFKLIIDEYNIKKEHISYFLN